MSGTISPTQVFPFNPSPNYAFQFNPILDGNAYIATILWNVFGQRWYLSLADLSQNLVINFPVVSAAPALRVCLTSQLFNDQLSYNSLQAQFEVWPA